MFSDYRFFFSSPLTLTSCPSLQIPEEFDIDSENSEDCFLCPEYAKDIFDYLKDREVRTLRNKSSDLNRKLDVTSLMLDHLSGWQINAKLWIIRRKSSPSVTTWTCSPASTRRWEPSWLTGWLKCRWVSLPCWFSHELDKVADDYRTKPKQKTNRSWLCWLIFLFFVFL